MIFTSCDMYQIVEKYPHFKANYWYCAEIDFSFHYEYNDDGRINPTTYPLELDGEILNVDIWFLNDYWYFYLDNGDETTSFEELLLSGTWEYRRNELVLTIQKDNLFGEKYQEFIFISKEPK